MEDQVDSLVVEGGAEARCVIIRSGLSVDPERERPLLTMNADRAALVQRGIRLSYLTIGYNSVEAVLSVAAGLAAGSVALVSFGIDSAIEVTAAGAAQFRLRRDHDPVRRASAERVAHRIIGASFLLLALYVLLEASRSLWLRHPPESSRFGLIVLVVSVVVMPLLARAKKKVAAGLGSGALKSDAAQTSLCAYLSLIALIGVAFNALLGWWWADPLAAMVMTPIIVKEGLEGLS